MHLILQYKLMWMHFLFDFAKLLDGNFHDTVPAVVFSELNLKSREKLFTSTGNYCLMLTCRLLDFYIYCFCKV